MLDEREEVERGSAGGSPEGGRSPTGGLPPAGAPEHLPARGGSGVFPPQPAVLSGPGAERGSAGRVYLSGILPPGAIPAHPGLPPLPTAQTPDAPKAPPAAVSSDPECFPDDPGEGCDASFAEEFPEVG